MPRFAWKLGSMSGKRSGEPSAPSPLYAELLLRQSLLWRMRNLPEVALSCQSGRERDSIVECKPQRLMNLFTASLIKEVREEVIPQGEERATCSYSYRPSDFY